MTDSPSIAESYTNDPLFPEIADEMVSWLGEDSSGHDMDHAWRVLNVGLRIAEEEGADAETVGAAALTHDIHRAMGADDEYVHPEETLPDVRAVLEATEFPPGKIDAVLHCVEVHDEYEFRGIERPVETLEAEILRDADNLDAIDAVGVARNFAFTGVVGNPLWDPSGGEYSGIEHFSDKLLKLEGEMNTGAARALAEERHAFLAEFQERFEAEWYGKR